MLLSKLARRPIFANCFAQIRSSVCSMDDPMQDAEQGEEPDFELGGVDINAFVRARRARVAAHRAQLIPQGFCFCDADPEARANQRLRALPRSCVNLVDHAVFASSEDSRDQGAGVLPALSSLLVAFSQQGAWPGACHHGHCMGGAVVQCIHAPMRHKQAPRDCERTSHRCLRK